MKHIKASSKRAEQLWKQYLNSKYSTIYECYKEPSYNKRRAEAQCLHIMYETQGAFYRILSYNTMQFTCGWTTKEGNLRVETAQNTYIIEKGE